jgi:hypothetical protein
MSLHQRATFLSVFAIPALLDIILLTTTGRGLYLSGTMSDDEKHSATLALMISLLISGAVGTWITCGGSYYLISMAFSAMNMFVMTRLVGGLAFTLAIAVIGLIAVSATNGFNAGIVFFLYLIALTTYLSLLATLANFQYPGSGFQSVSRPRKFSIQVTDHATGASSDCNGCTFSFYFASGSDMGSKSGHLYISFCLVYFLISAYYGSTAHWVEMDNMVFEHREAYRPEATRLVYRNAEEWQRKGYIRYDRTCSSEAREERRDERSDGLQKALSTKEVSRSLSPGAGQKL